MFCIFQFRKNNMWFNVLGMLVHIPNVDDSPIKVMITCIKPCICIEN